MSNIRLDFDSFIRLKNNLHASLIYVESDNDFNLYIFFEGQTYWTEMTYSEIESKFGQNGSNTVAADIVIEIFKNTYLRDAVRAISVEDGAKITINNIPDDTRKFTLTSTGGQGTAGYAMIPVRLGSGKIRRCESCGQILLSGETSCPACGSEKITGKDAEVSLSKWIGWDFEGTVKWILKFLETYKLSQITDVNSDQKKGIKQALIDSIKDGWTLNKLEARIEAIVEDEEKARMIARTEVIRCANEGALLHYKESEIEKVKWVAVPSAPGGRTCDACLAMNGREFLIKDAENKIPKHVFCRCTWSPVVEK